MADANSGFNAGSRYGVGASRNNPPDVVNQLNKEINAALADPKMLAKFSDLGGEMLPGYHAKVIRAAGIKAE